MVKEDYNLHLTGGKHPPFRGVYLNPTVSSTSDMIIFEHILSILEQNKDVHGLKKSELNNFIIIARLHNVRVVIDNSI